MANSKAIFICSAGHSGSTLLDLILGSHKDGFSLGEITHLPKNIALNTDCMCGRSVKSCSLWSETANLLQQKHNIAIFNDPYKFDMGYINAHTVIDPKHQNLQYRIRNKVLLGLEYSLLMAGVIDIPDFGKRIEHSQMLFNAVRQVSHKLFVVDSSKSYLRAVRIYLSAPENVRIIMLTRDGRGVFNSGLKHGFSRTRSLKDWKKHYTRSKPLYHKHVAKEHLLHVRYEDLAVSTMKTTRSICDFLEVDFEPGMMNFLNKEHHITNGNNMRFNQNQIQLDESWRNSLSQEDLLYFATNAGKLNRSLGYDIE